MKRFFSYIIAVIMCFILITNTGSRPALPNPYTTTAGNEFRYQAISPHLNSEARPKNSIDRSRDAQFRRRVAQWTLPHNLRELTPWQKIKTYLHENRIAEITLDSENRLVAFRVARDGQRTTILEDLSAFFRSSSLHYMERKLRNKKVQDMPLAIRIILGEGQVMWQTPQALYIGEAWMQGLGIPVRFLYGWKKKPGIRKLDDFVRGKIKENEIDFYMNSQEMRNMGRAAGLPRTSGRMRVDKPIPDPFVSGSRLLEMSSSEGGFSTFDRLPSRQPKLAKALDMRHWWDDWGYHFQYPDGHGIRARVKSIRGLFGTFWSAPGDGEASIEEIAKYWDIEGAVPIQALGFLHFHDMDDHLVGYIALFLLEEIMLLSRTQMRFIRRLLREEEVFERPKLRRFLERQREAIGTALDSLSAPLNRHSYHKAGFERGTSPLYLTKENLSTLTFGGRSVPQLAELWLQHSLWPASLRPWVRSRAKRFSKIAGLTDAQLQNHAERVIFEIENGFPSLFQESTSINFPNRPVYGLGRSG